jgi:type 1 glutamine amidotransferase
MTPQQPGRAHLITGGFPFGQLAGHDHDYARLRLLGLLAEGAMPATVGNDFADLGRALDGSRLLITYVAGPYPDAAQSAALQDWLAAGGHWLALHGTSGGKAARVEGIRNRRTVRTEHHAVLGSFFLTHPPICEFRIEVAPHPLTAGLPASFSVTDEPYFIELEDPARTTVLLTADYGAAGDWPPVQTLYGKDTSLQADGRTRVLGYTKPVGQGAVTYVALGHCHTPAIHATRGAAAAETTPPTFHGAWDSDAFIALLRNAIAWKPAEAAAR